MNLSVTPVEPFQGWMIFGIVTGIVLAVFATWLVFYLKAPRRSQYQSKGHTVSLVLIALTFCAIFGVFAVRDVEYSIAHDSTEQSLLAAVEETYGIQLTEPSAEALRTFHQEGEEDEQWLTSEELLDGFGQNEVFRYGTTELLINNSPAQVQLVWMGEWRLVHEDSGEELTRI